MGISSIRAGIAAAAIVACTASHAALAQTGDYYAGKRLIILVNYAPGGPADIEGRFFARHIAKHIGGGPNVIVQNMDGAGGMVGATYMGEVAPKDGTMVGMLTASAWQFATELTQRKVEFKNYEFVALPSISFSRPTRARAARRGFAGRSECGADRV